MQTTLTTHASPKWLGPILSGLLVVALVGSAPAHTASAARTHRVVATVTPLSLPLGNWNIDGNGYDGTLSLTALDVAGNLSGTAWGVPIHGFYDAVSGKIMFVYALTSDPSTHQIYTGYLFTEVTNPRLYTLAGSFEAFAGIGGVAQRCIYGWYATTNRS